jgi:hypothetical protein
MGDVSVAEPEKKLSKCEDPREVWRGKARPSGGSFSLTGQLRLMPADCWTVIL